MVVPESENIPRCIELKIDGHPKNIAPTRRAVESFALACGFDESAQGEIGLCVNEALANVLRHAYQGATGQPISIKLENMVDGIRIAIRDWGLGVNPLLQPRKEPDPLRPGGLGLFLLRQMMDEVHFQSQTDGMLLTMVRRKRESPPCRRQARDCG